MADLGLRGDHSSVYGDFFSPSLSASATIVTNVRVHASAGAGFRASSFLACYGLAEHSLAATFAPNGITVDTVDADCLVRRSIAGPAVPESTQVVRLVSCGRAFPGQQIAVWSIFMSGRTDNLLCC
jgi:hypothetical protein